MVVRHGHVVAEGWWAPYTPERPGCCTRSARASPPPRSGSPLAEGLFDLDDPVVSHFPEFADRDHRSPQPRGHAAAPGVDGQRPRPRHAGTRLGQRDPRGAGPWVPAGGRRTRAGHVFAYSQPCTYTLAAIIQRVTGQRLSEYLRPRLFDPLGIGEVGWQYRPPGRSWASAACSPAPRTSPSSASSTCSAAAGVRTQLHPRGVRRGRHVPTDRDPGEEQRRLATGLRLPVLDGPPRLSR